MIFVSDRHEGVLREAFSKKFFEVLSSLESEERIIIGLSGGSSFDLFYSELSENFHRIPATIREKLYFAFLDERIVETDHADRNEKQLRDKFLGALIEKKLLQEVQILSVDISKGDIAGAYSMRVPHIHIGLFGVGPDGHIASLFPHHPLILSESDGFLEITDSPKPPPHRITVAPQKIHSIDYKFLSVMRGKEEVLARFLDDIVGFKELPVRLLGKSNSTILMTNIDGVSSFFN